MFNTALLRENTAYFFQREFVFGLLILNALYWQQCDEDSQDDLKDDYATPLTSVDYELLTLYDVDCKGIPHFRDLNNVQRLSVWHHMYINMVKVSSDRRNCAVKWAEIAALAILMVAVEDELKRDTSIQPKVDKFSRRIAIYGHEILTVRFSGDFVTDNVIKDFPLTFVEACSLIPFEYEIRPEGNTDKKKYGSYPMYFEKLREELIDELRSSRSIESLIGLSKYEAGRIESFAWLAEREARRSKNYIDFFYENVPRDHFIKETVKGLLGKYGEEYLRAAYSVDTKEIERWGELFHDFGIGNYDLCASVDCNDINSNITMVTALVGDMNRQFKEEFDEEHFDLDGPFPEQYEPIPVEYFLIKDYVAVLPPREQAMPRLVQLVLYRLYAGKSFKLDDVDKLNTITTPMRSALSVQSALTLSAYRCGVLLTQLQLIPCEYGKAVIDELFPNLDTFFQRGMSVARPL